MNKIIVFGIIISLIGIQKISAQNYLKYYETINKAELANLDEDFQKSDSTYQEAFDLVQKPFKDDYLLAAINSEKLNNNQHTFKYLKNGITVGLTIKNIKKRFSSFKKSDEWKLLKKNYSSIRQEYIALLNLTLRKQLMNMVDKDQAARHPIFGSWRKMKKTDNYNHKRLLEIIKDNNGKWPGRFTIGDGNERGKYAFGEVTIMLHHFSKVQVNDLKPILVDAILEGDLSPYNVAYPLDYKNYKKIGERKQGKTIFSDVSYPIGSYISTMGNPPVIYDCEKSEVERKKLGLEPLDDYFRKRNSTYKCYEQK